MRCRVAFGEVPTFSSSWWAIQVGDHVTHDLALDIERRSLSTSALLMFEHSLFKVLVHDHALKACSRTMPSKSSPRSLLPNQSWRIARQVVHAQSHFGAPSGVRSLARNANLDNLTRRHHSRGGAHVQGVNFEEVSAAFGA
jgi:hypothetical protein